MLSVKWHDKVTLRFCNAVRHHHWTAFSTRDDYDGLGTYSGCLVTGSRRLSSTLRHKDVIETYLKYYGIDPLHWQTVAEDRSTWRANRTGSKMTYDIKAYRTNHDFTDDIALMPSCYTHMHAKTTWRSTVESERRVLGWNCWNGARLVVADRSS